MVLLRNNSPISSWSRWKCSTDGYVAESNVLRFDFMIWLTGPANLTFLKVCRTRDDTRDQRFRRGGHEKPIHHARKAVAPHEQQATSPANWSGFTNCPIVITHASSLR